MAQRAKKTAIVILLNTGVTSKDSIAFGPLASESLDLAKEHTMQRVTQLRTVRQMLLTHRAGAINVAVAN